MIPAPFDYVRPGNLDETLRILKDREGEAKLLSGGYSLLPLIKLRLAQPALLVDLRDVSGLDGITETDDYLAIGARATHRRIHEAPIVRDRYPLLHDVTSTIGDPQVRNWGTIGGSVAHADPASDWPAVLLATNASIVCRGLGGDPHQMRVGQNPGAVGDGVRERVLPARGFFLDTFQTAIEPLEVLTEIRIPRRPRGAGGAYEKLERKVGDFATVAVAARVALDDGGRIGAVGIGLTGVAETPFAATDAEAVLTGQAPSDDVFREAGAAAAAQSRPAGDVRGPVEYKRAMVAELTLRALRRATERALANS
ncbi:MAG TPA: xanthine dehydrogenase family protein subunit M [Candidatus Limnocylindrales bacterium]|nr:xanthine dehydrogenase family protein subunit M [Candidatus Limnocylindrales bacterium]